MTYQHSLFLTDFSTKASRKFRLYNLALNFRTGSTEVMSIRFRFMVVLLATVHMSKGKEMTSKLSFQLLLATSQLIVLMRVIDEISSLHMMFLFFFSHNNLFLWLKRRCALQADLFGLQCYQLISDCSSVFSVASVFYSWQRIQSKKELKLNWIFPHFEKKNSIFWEAPTIIFKGNKASDHLVNSWKRLLTCFVRNWSWKSIFSLF